MTPARRAAAALALAALGALAACSRARPHDLHGVRLGMTPADVRERFDAPKGTWRTTPGEDLRLDYAPPSASGPTARFEFHNGMLVAVRASLHPSDPEAKGAPREVTPGSVLARHPEGERVAVTWLARDCPTHKDEAARLVGAP